MPTRDQALVDLGSILAAAFPDSARAGLFARHAGLDPRNYDLRGAPAVFWDSILTEAACAGRLESLVQLAERAAPGAQDLPAALDAYRQAADGSVPAASQRTAPDPSVMAEYLRTIRDHCGWAKTHVYQILATSGRTPNLPLLDEEGRRGVYVPLRYDLQAARGLDEDLSSGRRRRKRGAAGPGTLPDGGVSGALAGLRAAQPQTDVDLQDVLAQAGHVVFVGGAGSGKTTVLKLIATILARQDARLARDLLGLAGALPLPIFIELRDFEAACQDRPGRPAKYARNAQDLLRYIEQDFRCDHCKDIPAGFLQGLIESGKAWLLLDALDEVPDLDNRRQMRNVIEQLGADFPSVRLLITARVAAYPKARFDDRFHIAFIRDLEEAQWAPMMQVLYSLLEQEADAAMMRSRKLTGRIAESEFLRRMVATPLRVWTATTIDFTGRELPEQRALLYDAYVEMLLAQHLKEAGDTESLKVLRDYGGWSVDDRRELLTNAAYNVHRQAAEERADDQAPMVVDETRLVRQVFAPLFRSYLGRSDAEARSEAALFVQAMTEQSGLLNAEPEGYTFGEHLQDQEFLAARYVANNVSGDERLAFLKEHVGDSWWKEVVLLTAGLLKARDAKRFLEEELGKLEGDGDLRAYGVAWAGEALLEIPPRHFGWHDQVRGALAERALQVLWRKPPTASVAARIEVGDVLGRLGDAQRFPGPCGLPEFIQIKAGTWSMGSDEAEVERLVKETGKEYWRDEAPRHQVRLNGFAIAKYPTTNAMFRRFWDPSGANGYADATWWTEAIADGRWKEGKLRDLLAERTQPAYWDDARLNGPSQPVVGVTWYEAVAYCSWLTAIEGDGCEYRLPTEAEWERVARGPEARRYPWGDEWRHGVANTRELHLERTSPMGVFPDGASAEGVLDLAGNVWEWCSDWYDEKAYNNRHERVVLDPKGPAKGKYKVLRGGSWYGDQRTVRCASRNRTDPDYWLDALGFRVARSLC